MESLTSLEEEQAKDDEEDFSLATLPFSRTSLLPCYLPGKPRSPSPIPNYPSVHFSIRRRSVNSVHRASRVDQNRNHGFKFAVVGMALPVVIGEIVVGRLILSVFPGIIP